MSSLSFLVYVFHFGGSYSSSLLPWQPMKYIMFPLTFSLYVGTILSESISTSYLILYVFHLSFIFSGSLVLQFNLIITSSRYFNVIHRNLVCVTISIFSSCFLMLFCRVYISFLACFSNCSFNVSSCLVWTKTTLSYENKNDVYS